MLGYIHDILENNDSEIMIAEIARLTFVNICVRFLAFEGDSIKSRVFLEHILCCFKERSAGQL